MNIIVAGASKGIGSSISRYWHNNGHAIVGLARSPESQWEHRNFTSINCLDVTNELSVKTFFKDIMRELKTIDLVVNCTGVFSARLLVNSDSNHSIATFSNNFISADNLMREFGKIMLTKKRGTFINLNSLASRISIPGNGIYGATKSALERLTRAYAIEFSNFGISYFGIGVSFFDGESMSTKLTEKSKSQYLDHLIMKSEVNLLELIDIIEFLNSKAAKHLNGQTLYLGSPQ